VRALLLTRRWLGFTVLAVVVAAGCVRLGLWQLHRAEQRSAATAAVSERTARAPVPVRDLLEVDRRPDASIQWRRVTASGRYDAASTLLLRNQVLDGRTGYHVVVPLMLDDGSALLVNRGWVPRTGPATAPVAVPEPPTGQLTVTGRVRTGDRVADDAGLERSDQPQPSVGRLDPSRVAAGRPLLGGYVELIAEDPRPGQTPTPVPPPQGRNPGINYSYAAQWMLFAVVGVVGWWFLLRRERDHAAQASVDGGATLTRTG